MKKKGIYPAVLIGADEAAVDLFLKGKISFVDIPNLIEETLSAWNYSEPSNLDDAIEYVSIAKNLAEKISLKFN